MNPLVNVLLGVAFLGETLSGGSGRPSRSPAPASPSSCCARARSLGCRCCSRPRSASTASCASAPPSTPSAASSPRPPSSRRLALGFLGFRAASGAGAFGSAPGTSALLAAAGAITALPLVWFTLGVHRLRLSTMGLVQYIAPTGQFLLGVALYREPFTRAHAAAFGLIWASLALYTWDALARRPRDRAVTWPHPP